MDNNKFSLCPECGSRKIEYKNRRKWFCPDCGFDLYNNVASAVGVIIADSENNVLFEVRAKEPRKGFIAVPGGFVDPDESAEEAAIREVREETGLEVDHVEYLCSFPNDYLYKGIAYKTCDMFFVARLPECVSSVQQLIQLLKGQESEVTAFQAWKVDTMEDLEKLPLAFESARKTLTVWINKRKITK